MKKPVIKPGPAGYIWTSHAPGSNVWTARYAPFDLSVHAQGSHEEALRVLGEVVEGYIRERQAGEGISPALAALMPAWRAATVDPTKAL